jgi:asparagine synthetase B (glutamine-hydrolysing)
MDKLSLEERAEAGVRKFVNHPFIHDMAFVHKVEELRAILAEQMNQAAVGRDRLAVQLSGGLDSAIVYHLAKGIVGPGNVDAYCVSWEEEDWEYLRDACVVAGADCRVKTSYREEDLYSGEYRRLKSELKHYDKSKINLVTFSKQEMLSALPEIAGITNGKCNWSQVGQWFCNKQIKEDGHDLVLTGEAADELFGGYSRYKILWWLDQMFKDPKLEAYRPMIEQVVGTKWDIIAKMIGRNKQIPTSLVELYCDPNAPLTHSLMTYEQHECLDQILETDKLMATCHELDNIFPFAAQEVRDFAKCLPTEYLFNENYTKLILRAFAYEIGVPLSIINEKTKKGFFIPQSWRPEGEPLWSTTWFDSLVRKVVGSSR